MKNDHAPGAQTERWEQVPTGEGLLGGTILAGHFLPLTGGNPFA
jgi:hypothetical protein